MLRWRKTLVHQGDLDVYTLNGFLVENICFCITNIYSVIRNICSDGFDGIKCCIYIKITLMHQSVFLLRDMSCTMQSDWASNQFTWARLVKFWWNLISRGQSPWARFRQLPSGVTHNWFPIPLLHCDFDFMKGLNPYSESYIYRRRLPYVHSGFGRMVHPSAINGWLGEGKWQGMEG